MAEEHPLRGPGVPGIVRYETVPQITQGSELTRQREVTRDAELLLYRDMDVDDDGLPLVVAENFGLGVRVEGRLVDIAVDSEGYVQPTTGPKGGMSVTPYDPHNLHELHRPPELDNGRGSYPVWEISAAALDVRMLRYRETSPTHGLIEPAERMKLEDFQQALADTRKYWTRVVG